MEQWEVNHVIVISQDTGVEFKLMPNSETRCIQPQAVRPGSWHRQAQGPRTETPGYSVHLSLFVDSLIRGPIPSHTHTQHGALPSNAIRWLRTGQQLPARLLDSQCPVMLCLKTPLRLGLFSLGFVFSSEFV